MSESGVDPSRHDSEVVMKAQALISGWTRGILPENVLCVDMDIIFNPSPSEGYTIMHALDYLKYYDIVGVLEGWHLQLGMFAVRKKGAGLMHAWINNYREFKDISAERALMQAMERNEQYRLYPLPSAFNFRPSTVLPPMEVASTPTILQTHMYTNSKSSIRDFVGLVRHIAVTLLEDIMYNLSSVYDI
eukprot:CAMPEP_0185027966 /NCGR_PEP_ID=MMETSP1103-20130426/13353_1 /TAXON_ID=36769 /ORGANISM="Paraphysomonas bandaiensis, Strain Caron Lab Isolate" /LENGTH=188 /DNA_ID=CAMNT_0027562183 /DNA_START=280 /DNA_END=846 /DNA_ORIENTATION=+